VVQASVQPAPALPSSTMAPSLIAPPHRATGLVGNGRQRRIDMAEVAVLGLEPEPISSGPCLSESVEPKQQQTPPDGARGCPCSSPD
jgi:hypothetical protein